MFQQENCKYPWYSFTVFLLWKVRDSDETLSPVWVTVRRESSFPDRVPHNAKMRVTLRFSWRTDGDEWFKVIMIEVKDEKRHTTRAGLLLVSGTHRLMPKMLVCRQIRRCESKQKILSCAFIWVANAPTWASQSGQGGSQSPFRTANRLLYLALWLPPKRGTLILPFLQNYFYW